MKLYLSNSSAYITTPEVAWEKKNKKIQALPMGFLGCLWVMNVIFVFKISADYSRLRQAQVSKAADVVITDSTLRLTVA